MAEVKSTGPSTATIILIAVIATPVVLILVFWLMGSGTTADARSSLPDVRGKGLQWAHAQTKDSGFESVETHDALGRDRRWRDDKEWMVCFQVPAPGGYPDGTKVELGVVKTEERCPTSDQARFDAAGRVMPDLANRTAFMTRKILGENASLRFLDRSDGDEVNHGLGDWRVCGQTPKAGQRFDGVPVTTLVVKYEEKC